jgi:hypothetical protein
LTRIETQQMDSKILFGNLELRFRLAYELMEDLFNAMECVRIAPCLATTLEYFAAFCVHSTTVYWCK